MHKSNPKDTNGAGGLERAQTASRAVLRRVAACFCAKSRCAGNAASRVSARRCASCFWIRCGRRRNFVSEKKLSSTVAPVSAPATATPCARTLVARRRRARRGFRRRARAAARPARGRLSRRKTARCVRRCRAARCRRRLLAALAAKKRFAAHAHGFSGGGRGGLCLRSGLPRSGNGDSATASLLGAG